MEVNRNTRITKKSYICSLILINLIDSDKMRVNVQKKYDITLVDIPSFSINPFGKPKSNHMLEKKLEKPIESINNIR